MNPQVDSSGNTHCDVLNVRITCVPQTWNGTHGVRIQAYKGKGDALHPGAEIPVANHADAYRLAKTLVLAFNQLGL